MSDDPELSYRTFGTPGAARLVVLIGTGDVIGVDPEPLVTAAHDIRVLALELDAASIDDPGAFGGQTRAEQTASSLASLIGDHLRAPDGGRPSAAIVAYRSAGDIALRIAVQLEETIDRLALVAVPAPDGPLDRDDVGALIARVGAKTLVLDGGGDAATEAAAWFGAHLPSVTVDTVADVDLLTLTDVWGRVLDHVAPGSDR